MPQTNVLLAILGLSGLALATAPAQAAESYGPAPYAYWTGAYVGAQVGYGRATAEFTAPGEAVPFGSLDLSGWLWGGRGGMDIQRGNLVFGALMDVSFGNVSQTVINLGGGGSDVKATIDMAGSFRGRLGMAFNKMMIYGTGGLAVAHTEATVSNLAPGDTGSDTRSETHVGWTAGIGAEVALTETLSLGAEWLYSDYGTRNYHFDDGAGTLDANTSLTANSFLISLNMRFR